MFDCGIMWTVLGHLPNFHSSIGELVPTNLQRRWVLRQIIFWNCNKLSASILHHHITSLATSCDSEGTVKIQTIDGDVAVQHKDGALRDSPLALHFRLHVLKAH